MNKKKVNSVDSGRSSSQPVAKMWKALICAGLFLGSQAALSGPVVFSFDGVLDGGVDTNGFGVSLGDSYELKVRANNGSTDLANASWEFADILDAIFTSGTYSAFWDNADTTWFDSTDTPLFSTDAAGIVTVGNFQGTSSFTGTDNAGTTAYLYQDGVDTSLQETFFGTDFDGGSGWVVALDTPNPAPAPATLALLGLGLLGLRMRRKS